MLDENSLREYCEGFFGYGNLHGKYWFIGPEEAGGRCEEEVHERLELWDQHPEPRQIIDGFEFDAKRIFSQQPFHNPQSTWDRLIRVQLAAEGIDVDIAAFKETKWARKSAQNCLLDLLPLPCPNMNSWPHEDWTPRGVFQSRPTFNDEFIEHRIAGLRTLMNENEPREPRVVVFYGRLARRWSKIAGFRWRDAPSECFNEHLSAQFRRQGRTLFVYTYHPTQSRSKLTSGATDTYFDWVGEEIKERL